MKASINWIRMLNDKYQCAADPAPEGIDVLIEKIGAQLGAVEEVINLGDIYKGIVIAKVVSVDKHPNADKLKICWIDDGSVVEKIERNGKGYIQVVCGAPNVAAGQMVAWLPPGSTVPATFDKEPLVLEAREIRGIKSNGMIASAKELALGDNHDGILVVDKPTKAGDDFAKVYRLDDFIIDIENKMFTHRPDLFGQLGIARELAGIQGHMFVSPPIYKSPKIMNKVTKQKLALQIKNDVPELVPRFVAQVFSNIKVRPSPMWMQSYLSRVGIRPINNVVDITNYIMMLTAQPLHAYDYDKLETATLGIRLSKSGEKLTLLGGKELTLENEAVVITDGKRPIGLGGIMGGADTEVDETTKNIIIECASFDMNITRRSAMAYGLFTDAATRFTKNQSPWQNKNVIGWAAEELIRQAGGVPGAVYDAKTKLKANPSVKVSNDFINSRLGTNLSLIEIRKILENVEFHITQDRDNLVVKAPFWRTDITIAEDVVEEVGRLFGYHKLPVELPGRKIEPAPKDELLEFKNRLRYKLESFGANEILTYSFVDGRLFKKSGQDDKTAYKLANALSPELQYYRFSLMPSLLDKVHTNIKASYDEFTLFEIGKGHDKDHVDDDGLPQEFELLGLVFAASSKSNLKTSAYFEAKFYLDALASSLGLKLSYSPIDNMPKAPLAQPYEKQRSAMVTVEESGIYLGIIGEFRQNVRQELKLPKFAAGFEIDITSLINSSNNTNAYIPLSRFPQIQQDLCLRTSIKHNYAKLSEFLEKQLEKAKTLHGYDYELLPLDIFQKEGDKDHKQTTWRIVLSHPERTMTTSETNHLLDNISANAKKELNAERI